jgi:hypothetical protein
MHRGADVTIGQHGVELPLECLGCLEASAGVQIQLEEAIHRARYVAAHGIERFVLTAKAVGASCIDERAASVVNMCGHVRRVHGKLGAVP